MKVKRVICIVTKHKWVLGRVAERWARELVPSKKGYHNRACTRCDKEEWHADVVEKEAERILGVRKRLGFTKAQSESKLWDPMKKPLDPDEFP